MSSNEFVVRFQDILPLAATKVPITVIGAGAIGSNVILTLAKMGFNDITVYDFDKVDAPNIGCQLYGPAHIDAPKVTALAEIVQLLAGVEIQTVNRKWEAADRKPGIVVTAVDNMETRGKVFDAYRLFPACQLLVDPRMGAETASLLALTPIDTADQELWDASFYTSDSVEPAPCTAKATYYCASMLSGLAVKAIKDHVTGSDKAIRNASWSIKDNEFNAWSK